MSGPNIEILLLYCAFQPESGSAHGYVDFGEVVCVSTLINRLEKFGATQVHPIAVSSQHHAIEEAEDRVTKIMRSTGWCFNSGPIWEEAIGAKQKSVAPVQRGLDEKLLAGIRLELDLNGEAVAVGIL
jgi:hypothetical protein